MYILSALNKDELQHKRCSTNSHAVDSYNLERHAISSSGMGCRDVYGGIRENREGRLPVDDTRQPPHIASAAASWRGPSGQKLGGNGIVGNQPGCKPVRLHPLNI